MARVIAGACEAVYMYVAMRWLVFRDTRAKAVRPDLNDHVDGTAACERLGRLAYLSGDIAYRNAVAPDDAHLHVLLAQHHTGDAAAGQIGADCAQVPSGQPGDTRRGGYRRRHLVGRRHR